MRKTIMSKATPGRSPKTMLMTADAVGGVWTYAMELIGALNSFGWHVTLAVLGPEPSDAQWKEVTKLNNCECLCGGNALEWMNNPWCDVEATGEWLQELAEEHSPDLVHLNDYSHATRRWRCPVVVAAHSCVSTWWKAVRGETVPSHYAEYRRRVRSALLTASAVVAPTIAWSQQLTEEYGVDISLGTIPNARSAELFRSGPKETCILSAGRLWDEGKNIRLLNRIAHEVDWEIAVAGETKLDQTHTTGTQSLRWLGQLNSGEMIDVLGRAAIYAAPARYEPFGLAILEAALSGCALVLSDLPSLREIWNGCALFVPADDDQAWIRALNGMIRDESRRKRFQERARARAMTLNPERQAQSYSALYQALLTSDRQIPELSFA
jgi:glycogen synthase